jgi:hypothetical protein
VLEGTPQEPAVGYEGQGSSDCMGNAQTAVGSWQLSLTSVVPNDAGASSGATYFAPHGTFTATMVGGTDGGTDTANLSATF